MSARPQASHAPPAKGKPVTLSKLAEKKALGEPIVMVTAYDHPSAVAVEAAEVDIVLVGESSLYPALQRLLLNGWVTAEWGTSENNRRARYYTLTAAGKKRLVAETRQFDRMIGAIRQVMDTA